MKKPKSKSRSNLRFTFVKIIGALILIGSIVALLYTAYSLAPRPAQPIEITNFDVLRCVDKEFANVTCYASGQTVIFRNLYVPNTEYQIPDNMRSSLNVPVEYQYTFRIRENKNKWLPAVLCLTKDFHRFDEGSMISYLSGTLMYYYNPDLKDWLPYLYANEVRP